ALETGEIIVAEHTEHPAAADLKIATAANGAEPATAANGVLGALLADILIEHAVAAAAVHVAAGPVVDLHRRRPGDRRRLDGHVSRHGRARYGQCCRRAENESLHGSTPLRFAMSEIDL